MAVLVQQSTTRALGEDVLVQHSTIGVLGKLCWYRKVLMEHSGLEAVLVQRSTIGALERLCRYRRVLKEHLGYIIGTVAHYKNTREAVLVQ